MKPVVIVHGGAGTRRPGGTSADAERARALGRAVATAFHRLQAGALEACVAAVAVLEDCARAPVTRHPGRVYAHEVHARMLLAGESVADASAAALEAVRAAGGLGGAICVSRTGEIAMPCIDMGMSHAWRSGDDPVRSVV